MGKKMGEISGKTGKELCPLKRGRDGNCAKIKMLQRRGNEIYSLSCYWGFLYWDLLMNLQAGKSNLEQRIPGKGQKKKN